MAGFHLADTRNIIKLIKDGGRITEIEKRTLSYILENYNFTDTAIKYIEKTLSESLLLILPKKQIHRLKQVIKNSHSEIIS